MEQSSFWLILLFCFLFGLLHSILALNDIKEAFRKKCGNGAARMYRILYVAFALITTGLLGGSVIAYPDFRLYTIPAPWVYLALFIQFSAAVCLMLAFLQSHPFQFIGIDVFIAPGRQEEKPLLMTSGFFAWTRHPLYFFAFVLMWFFPFMTWNLLALFTGLTVYTLLGSLLEEGRMLQDYGDEYKAYQRRTPWMIPNPFKSRR